MKRFFLALMLVISSTFVSAQYDIKPLGRPSNPSPNISYFVGPQVSLNLVDYAAFGAMGGVSFKDIFLMGPFYQHSIRNTNYYGLYTQVNVNPKHYFFTIGFTCKAGLLENKYLSFEPGMAINHTTYNDKFKFSHNITFVGGWPAYSFGVWYGNFGEKWWKNPGKVSKYQNKRIEYRHRR